MKSAFTLLLSLIALSSLYANPALSANNSPMRQPQAIRAPIATSQYRVPYNEPRSGLTLKRFGGRTHYIHTPSRSRGKPSLLLLLHGAKRTGASMIDKWKDIAERENIVLLAPTAPQTFWLIDRDEIIKLLNLVEHAQNQYGTDPQKTYIFGHSSGANMAIALAAFNSNFFTAASLHAGFYPPGTIIKVPNARAGMPVAFFTGTKDPHYPLKSVRASAKALHHIGLDVSQYEITGHNHWYYDIADFVNKRAWKAMTAK